MECYDKFNHEKDINQPILQLHYLAMTPVPIMLYGSKHERPFRLPAIKRTFYKALGTKNFYVGMRRQRFIFLCNDRNVAASLLKNGVAFLLNFC